MKRRWLLVVLGAYLLGTVFVEGGESSSVPGWTEELYSGVRPSVVVVKQVGEHGESASVGTGFAVQGGLVATCFHVIGEGQRIMLELPDGRETPVTEITAWDEVHDMALLKPLAASLEPLPLADENAKPGAPVMAVGNPRGLRGSVTTGILSADREIDGHRMLQLAIPIELGNSGGPLLNQRGEVLGMLTYKSAITDNLGFATPIAQLKHLRKHSKPVSITRWMGLNALDTNVWTTAYGGSWRSVRGAITASCQGEAGTGRTICWQRQSPANDHNVCRVWIRFDSATGGAGIAFGNRSSDRHGGVFVSEGRIWLVEFESDRMLDWDVIESTEASGWESGEWNELRIQQTSDRIRASLNGHELLVAGASETNAFERVGLLKLGRSHPHYRGFKTAAIQPAQDQSDAIRHLVEYAVEIQESVESPNGDELRLENLEAAARQLEHYAERIRLAQTKLAQHRVAEELHELVAKKGFDTARAALLASQLAAPDEPAGLAWEEWQRALGSLKQSAKGKKSQLPDILEHFFFEQLGWRVPATERVEHLDYSLTAVWDRQRVAPELLKLLSLSAAQAINLPVANSKHLHPEDSDPRKELITILRSLVAPQMAQPNIEALPVLETIIKLDPNPVRERFARGWIRFREGDHEAWQEDWAWVRSVTPEHVTRSWVEACLAELHTDVPAWRIGLQNAHLANR